MALMPEPSGSVPVADGPLRDDSHSDVPSEGGSYPTWDELLTQCYADPKRGAKYRMADKMLTQINWLKFIFNWTFPFVHPLVALEFLRIWLFAIVIVTDNFVLVRDQIPRNRHDFNLIPKDPKVALSNSLAMATNADFWEQHFDEILAIKHEIVRRMNAQYGHLNRKVYYWDSLLTFKVVKRTSSPISFARLSIDDQTGWGLQNVVQFNSLKPSNNVTLHPYMPFTEKQPGFPFPAQFVFGKVPEAPPGMAVEKASGNCEELQCPHGHCGKKGFNRLSLFKEHLKSHADEMYAAAYWNLWFGYPNRASLAEAVQSTLGTEYIHVHVKRYHNLILLASVGFLIGYWSALLT